jgi:Protein of unknown function (DUF3467)
MSDVNSGGSSGGQGGGEVPMQRIAHSPMSARVPERINRGVVATGFLAYLGQQELVVDFLQFIGRPPQLAARVVMTPAVAEQFLAVLRENLSRFTATYGPPPVIAKNPNDKPRPAQEIYDDLKIQDEQLSGVYANAVMIGHTPAEFGLDFITNFFPTAAVSARVYLAAARVPQLIDTVAGLVTQHQRRTSPPQGGGGGATPGTAPGIPGFPYPPGGN